MNKKLFSISLKPISVHDVYDIAFNPNIQLELSQEVRQKIIKSRNFVLKKSTSNETIYGINTGFGALSSQKIEESKLKELQYNLIRSHCTGVGEPFSKPISKAMMFLRVQCLVQGHSGVSLEIVEQIISLYNLNIIPVIPQKGSVGASGDLAPLAHLAITLIGEGQVFLNNEIVETKIAFKKFNLVPVELGPKDGLALINGTATMSALGALAVHKAIFYAKLADISCALTLEATRGTSKAFDPRISELKPHPGQIVVSRNLNKILTPNSEISLSHTNCEKVQDPYSLRCVPQVHGACRQTITHAENVVSIEINSVTDNPLVFIKDNEIISGGNFHGEAIALAMDYLSMGMSELANIAERRVEKLMNPSFSGLPAFLAKNSGLNSGLMIAHVTMASLVSESKTLCFPSSVDSIPTSTDKEDHVSMGVTSGRKLHSILDNLKYCLAIELLCSTQGIEFLRPLKTTPLLEQIITKVRTVVPPIDHDRQFNLDINAIIQMIDDETILENINLE